MEHLLHQIRQISAHHTPTLPTEPLRTLLVAVEVLCSIFETLKPLDIANFGMHSNVAVAFTIAAVTGGGLVDPFPYDNVSSITSKFSVYLPSASSSNRGGLIFMLYRMAPQWQCSWYLPQTPVSSGQGVLMP